MGVHAPKKSQNHKAKFIGTSYDIDYDQETQNLCGAPGFLLLGTLVCFILGPHIIFHICCFQALVRLALSQVLSLKVGSLFIVAICCRSFSAMLLGLDSFVRLCGAELFFSEMGSIFFQQRCRHTSGRTVFDPAGNESFAFVKEGNLMAARCACLIMVASCLKVIWMVEQPRGTILWIQSRIDALFKTISATWQLVYWFLFEVHLVIHTFFALLGAIFRSTVLAFGWVLWGATIQSAMN